MDPKSVPPFPIGQTGKSTSHHWSTAEGFRDADPAKRSVSDSIVDSRRDPTKTAERFDLKDPQTGETWYVLHYPGLNEVVLSPQSADDHALIGYATKEHLQQLVDDSQDLAAFVSHRWRFLEY